MRLQGSSRWRASDERSFLGAPTVVAIPITKKIGILLNDPFTRHHHRLSHPITRTLLQIINSDNDRLASSSPCHNTMMLAQLHLGHT
jgi:hypothetical protein